MKISRPGLLVGMWAVALVMSAAGPRTHAAEGTGSGGPSGRKDLPPPAPATFGWPGFGAAWGLPGYALLDLDRVQQELRLTPEQQEQLRALAEKHQSETQRPWDRTEVRKLSPDEQKQRMDSWLKQAAQRQAEVRTRVDAILRPDQRERLQDIRFRVRAPGVLSNPHTLEQLGVSEEQRAELRNIQVEWHEKRHKLQQEMLEKSLETLTPEQRAKLKEQVHSQPL